jgi:DNA-directed RNA polymerase subunit RPC12/RpoP
MAGSRIDCPKCQAKVLVPGFSNSKANHSDDDEWFSLDAKPQAAGVDRKEVERSSDDPPRSLFDDDLPDLVPLTQPPPVPVDVRSDQALPSMQREYSIRCKVCKTLLSVRENQAGSQVRCPNCHSMIVVGPPPVKKPTNEIKIDELEASVQLEPVQGNNPRIVSGASINTKEILSKASRELQKERDEIDAVSGAFDSKEWLSRILGFLSDVRMVLTLVALGFLFTVAYYLYAFLPFAGESSVARILQRLREESFLVVTQPLQIALFICAVAIIPKAANRAKQIEPWPFFKNLKDYMGPAVVGFVVFLATNLLANMVSGSLASLKVPVLLRDAFAEVIQWACLPVIYLSMLETQNYTKPFSMSIFRSITGKPDAWGAMYMQSGIVWVIYFVVWQAGILSIPWAGFLAGFVFPWFICFVANQYGVLAGRISDVTDLGYEGDFTENE